MENETSLADDISAAMSGSGNAPSQSTETSATTADTTASTGTATTQPADAAAATTSADDNTPGPRLRDHKQILENTRTKATQEAEARFEQQYGWAKQFSEQDFTQLVDIARVMNTADPYDGLFRLMSQIHPDPIEAMQRLMAKARANPEVDTRLKSMLGRALAQSRQSAEPQMVSVQLEDGSIVPMPRDPAAWLAHQKQQWLAEVQEQFQPVTKTIETLQAERAQAVQQQRVDHFVSTTFADVQTWPGMGTKEAQASVAREIAQARIDPNDPREVAMALDRAYRKCILPTLSTASRQAALNDVTFKAQTNTVSPSHQSTGSPKSTKDMSWSELFRSEMAAGRK